MRRVMNFTKKVAAGFLAAAVIIAGVAIIPVQDVKAATEGTEVPSGVTYVSMAVTEATPTKAGYLFGGWYQDDADDAFYSSKPAVGTQAYAKFVPAYVLSVKAQNYYGKGSEATTTTRLVSSVDSDDYAKVGFEIIKQDETTKDKEVSKVYNYLKVKTSSSATENYEAKNVFGAGAKYFAVLELNNIPQADWSQNTYIRPYWVTPDGTKVTGLPKYVRVDDGYEGYISVAVNLKTAEDIAAGVVNVSYDNTKLKFDSYYKGRVFEEMEVADKGTSVKCVGNVEDISVSAQADDMYISLRFEVTDTSYKVGSGTFLQFGMSEVDFANIDEGLVTTLDVWNVQY